MMAFANTKPTFAEDLGTEIVDIFVGPQRKRYVVHKKLLTIQSDYFDKALNGRFKEAKENSIHLKEEDPGAVSLLIGWLYRGVMPGTEMKLSPFSSSCSSSSITHIPVSEGSRYQYAPVTMNDPNAPQERTTFQHLCGQAVYSNFSPEEIRLADYKVNRLYQTPNPLLNQATNPFAPAPQNTATPPGVSLFSSLGGTTGGLSPPVPGNPFANFATVPTASHPPSFIPNLNRAFGTSMNLSPTPTSEQATPKPSSFGSSRTVKHPKSAGVFLDGIPRTEPINDQMVREDYQQRCLVHLCILAETICWPALFNAAVEAYVQGERNLHRPIPLEHVDLIYDRTHYESTLRLYVIDSISRLDGEQDHLTYMPLAQKYDEFLEDLLRKVSGSASLSSFLEFDKYRMSDPLTQLTSNAPDGVFGKKDEATTLRKSAV